MRKNRHTTLSVKFFGEIIDQLHSIQDVEKYNIYLIVNTYLHNKSGVFTLDELVDVYHKKNKFLSLKDKSNTYKFKKNLYKIIKNSTTFFKHVEKETFKIISYRKILNNFGISKHKSTYFHFSLVEEDEKKNFILSKKIFLDHCIGTYLLRHKEFSNKQVAEHFNITVKRVQNATHNNNNKKTIIKRFRFAQTICNDRESARKLYLQLWNVGIRSIVKEKKKKFFVYTFRTNSYKTNLPSHLCRVRKNAEDSSLERKYAKVPGDSVTFYGSQIGKKLVVKIPPKDGDPILFSFYEKKDSWSLDQYIQQYGNLNM